MEIAGEGHLDFDRTVNPRSIRNLKIDLSEIDHVNLYDLMAMAIAVMDARNRFMTIRVTPPQDLGACAFISRLAFDRYVDDVAGIRCDLDLVARQSVSDVLVPLTRFRTSEELQPLQDLLINRLEGMASPQSVAALGEALWELGANATEHSGSEGIVAAVVQRPTKRKGFVHFAIGDAGIGIRRSFLKGGARYRPSSDHEAITLALQYLVSSVDDPGRGQGLHTTVEQATGLGGRVTIRTGAAKRSIVIDDRSRPDLRERASSVAALAGTLVVVNVPCRP